MKMKLKHRDFALTYLADPKRCAGRAYATVYGKDYENNRAVCDQSGSRLLKHVKVSAFIKEKDDAEEKRITEKYQVNQDKVTRELAAIGFANMGDYVEWDNDGVRLIPSDELTDMNKTALKKVMKKESKHGTDISIELHDKRQALVDLGKHLGMFIRKVELGLADELMAEFFKEIDGTTRSPVEKMN